MIAAALLAAMLVQPAPFDAYAYRTTQPAAFAAELGQLRAPVAAHGTIDRERLALLLLAADAASAAEYRRRVAELEAFHAELRATRERVFAGRYRSEWLNARWLNGSLAARDPDVRELLRRVFLDQHQLQQPVPEALGDAGNAIAGAETTRLARDNAEWLKGVLRRIGWFDISRYGAEASQAAWLIVQHADHDPPWQREMLVALRPRAARGDMQPSYFGYLVDRVAVNAGEPQTYGTQGRCVAPGDWQPHPLADPDGVDRRRAEIGLGPIAEYRARFTCR